MAAAAEVHVSYSPEELPVRDRDFWDAVQAHFLTHLETEAAYALQYAIESAAEEFEVEVDLGTLPGVEIYE
jgi:hypothetical protein